MAFRSLRTGWIACAVLSAVIMASACTGHSNTTTPGQGDSTLSPAQRVRQANVYNDALTIYNAIVKLTPKSFWQTAPPGPWLVMSLVSGTSKTYDLDIALVGGCGQMQTSTSPACVPQPAKAIGFVTVSSRATVTSGKDQRSARWCFALVESDYRAVFTDTDFAQGRTTCEPDGTVSGTGNPVIGPTS